ncbi:deferrochelatase/peroxidase EfeB [Paenarthrobacter nicotinovorans]|uniref:iron uptake transporter deferrochelatase/peroxidase subunit n=1 Tax=Micrococcaceae TaxID=1268 RepID=UPI0008764496|nr:MULTISPECIES: iron uptake transporter deferrochelatase/peroxidase subunit [Micrococcaceae]MDR6435451.1 deferrochelatase/peroxidase EfeB [Paenarthrobacter nicotinovorans]SCZ49749.1 deferrochelatase/peroxidase EfeB [Arthrobacter sp. UNCCL28]
MSGCPFGHTEERPDNERPGEATGVERSGAPAAVVTAEGASDGGKPADAAAGSSRMSRRGLLSLAGVGGAGAVAGLAAGFLGHDVVTAGPAVAETNAGEAVVPFFGDHQAGITTPAQDRLHMAAFDVTTEDRKELIKLLKDWTAAAEAMSTGSPTGKTGAVDGPYDAPPEDTGEALDLAAAKLTLTFGFGAGLFEKDGKARFGLDGRRPEALIDLPHFPGDDLQPGRTGGDIVIQACADDPQVAVHAIRNLARIGFGKVRVRWSQLGFGRTSSTSRAQVTPRNLFGFKDGTNNLKVEDNALLDEHVWVGAGPAGEQWMTGGSYLVARRIQMHIEIWDRTSLREQEGLIGRTKGAGAPLSGGDEFTAPDFGLKGRGDEPLIPMDSHMRLAHPDQNAGVRMLRRGYNFTDGSDGLGHLDAGLFFIAFVKDPRTHYVPMQLALAKGDTLSVEYLKHTGSGLFAVPPGVQQGGFIGEGLFA